MKKLMIVRLYKSMSNSAIPSMIDRFEDVAQLIIPPGTSTDDIFLSSERFENTSFRRLNDYWCDKLGVEPGTLIRFTT